MKILVNMDGVANIWAGIRQARDLVALLFVVAMPLSMTASVHADASSLLRPQCQDVTIPATIDSGQVSIYGQYCRSLFGRPTTVQLLVHGATYTHTYWNFPGFDGKYSYVDVASRAGYATLAIDRLGTGQSSHPASQDVTYQAEISTLHQVVQALRNGGVAHTAYPHVEYIGHSFGAAYGVGEVATYHDVDALMLTGYGHATSTLTRSQSSTFFYAANTEARFSALDPGYLTTKAGLRGEGGLFYDTALANPLVIAADEASKDTVTTAEFATRPANLGALTPNITVPVLIIDGQEDTHYCSSGANDCTTSQTFLNDEAPFFNTCLATELVQSGHDINLHVTAQASYRDFIRWSYATLSPYATHAHCTLQGAL